MLSRYERGLAMPSSDVLLALGDALGVRTEYFFRVARIELGRIEHRNRHRWRLPRKEERRVLADVQDQLERWSALDAVLPAPWSSDFSLPPALPARVADYDSIEDLAVAVRRHWNLGLGPVPDLIDTLEARGLKVFTTRFDSPRFEGLCASAHGQPVIVIGRQWPGDRQRFTLCHELGHLLLDERLAPHLDKEVAANRFAGAFLVPAPRVTEALGERRSALEPYELYLLKLEYGLSIAGWSYRARDLGLIGAGAHQAFWQILTRRGWNKTEPGEPYPPERPRLFEQLLYRALGESLISESAAAELLGLSVAELSARRRMETVDGYLRH